MAEDLDEKYARFVTKLIELTQLGDLKWRAKGRDSYGAQLGGRTLEIERKEDENYSKQNSNIVAAFGIGTQSPRRKYNYTLTVLKTDDADMFYLTNSYGVPNLFTSAVLSATKIETFIDKILSGE